MLNHKMSAAEIRLHMGELTGGEVEAVRAAISWANLEAEEKMAALLARVEESKNELAAWHEAFGTTQLTHAIARLECAEKESAALKVQLVTVLLQHNRLINAVNRVTAMHRHRRPIRACDLDALSNRQLEVERAIRVAMKGEPNA